MLLACLLKVRQATSYVVTHSESRLFLLVFQKKHGTPSLPAPLPPAVLYLEGGCTWKSAGGTLSTRILSLNTGVDLATGCQGPSDMCCRGPGTKVPPMSPTRKGYAVRHVPRAA